MPIAGFPDDSDSSKEEGEASVQEAVAGPAAAIPRPRTTRSAAATGVYLETVEVENLRNYDHAALELRPFTVIVGNNNQGKSSILRLVDWLLNQADEAVLFGRRTLRPDEVALLLPANESLHRARRLTLFLRFEDGRKARSYQPEPEDPKSVRLRLSVEKARGCARLNLGRPRKTEAASGSEQHAYALLELVRRQVQFILVPSARDARSGRFRAAIEERMQQLLLARFEHGGRQAGAPREYRMAREFLSKIDKVVEGASRDISASLKQLVPTDLMRDAKLSLGAGPVDLAEWIRDHLSLTLTTGDHDANHVDAAEVGNGLQSLLDLALSLASRDESGSQIVLALEEPEAFLHPGAQRLVAQRLRAIADAADGKCHADVIVTTHSPYMVEEARFGDVALVRNHRFFQPKDVEDAARGEINTSLMTVNAAEVFFSSGVLLVEGPSDRALFYGLLRRYQQLTGDPSLARLTVLEVGGKRCFAPWWRLLDSYQGGTALPIRYLSLFDADAAHKDDKSAPAIVEALAAAGRPLSSTLRDDLTAFGALTYEQLAERMAHLKKLLPSLHKLGVHVFSIDCEWAAFGGGASHNLALVQDVLNSAHSEPRELARTAGSKVGNGRTKDDAKKHPFRRQKLAERMDLAHLPEEVEAVLLAWFRLVMDEKKARRILSQASEAD